MSTDPPPPFQPGDRVFDLLTDRPRYGWVLNSPGAVVVLWDDLGCTPERVEPVNIMRVTTRKTPPHANGQR